MLPVFEADGHLKLARVNFPRVIRGSELDPESFLVPYNQLKISIYSALRGTASRQLSLGR